MDDLQTSAITNLAEHCEAVLGAHGSPTEIDDGLWLNRHTLSIPYANVITLEPATEVNRIAPRTVQFLRDRPDGSGSGVNDSFSDLELDGTGVRKLWSDGWLVREPASVKSSPADGLQIEEVSAADGLDEFDRACAAGFESHFTDSVYRDELLAGGRHRFWLGRVEGTPVSGVLTFNNGNSAGVYGLFTLPGFRRRGYADAVLTAAIESLAELPISTNPSAMSRQLFGRLGFRKVGERTIWVG